MLKLDLNINKETINDIFIEGNQIKEVHYNSQLIWRRSKYVPGTILFESNEPGTYTFTPTADCIISLILVSGGGGGATHQQGSRTGGQGALITGKTSLYKDIEYTVTVGAGGTYSYSTNINVGAQGGTGGTSTAFGNTCNGGTGAHAHTGWWAASYYDGSPGSGTVASSEFTLTTGIASTNGIYESYGAGGLTTDGTNGYCKISVISS